MFIKNIITKMTLVVFFLSISYTIYSFPLRKINKGDFFNYAHFEFTNEESKKSLYSKNKKAIIIWKISKENSKKIFVEFYKACREKSMKCISLELDNAPKEEVLKLLASINIKDFYYVVDKANIVEELGVFTLPVTIFLDEANTVIDAFGFEGQFYSKISNFIDFINGKLSKEDYDKISKIDFIDRKISILPKINFWNKLIEAAKQDEVIKELDALNHNDIKTDIELVKVSEIYMKLGNLEKALQILDKANQKDVTVRYHRALLYYKMEKINDALFILKEIEHIYPNRKNINNLLGRIYLRLGDYKNAAEYYDKNFDL